MKYREEVQVVRRRRSNVFFEVAEEDSDTYRTTFKIAIVIS